MVLSVETLRRFAFGALYLNPLQLRCYGTYDANGYFVLKVKNVLKCAIEAFGP
jgi:hypothetical protein